MIHNLSSRFKTGGPPKLKKDSSASPPTVSGPPDQDKSAKDRADIALEKLKTEKPASESKPQKKGLKALLGAAAMLGLAGLGIFQGAGGAAAAPQPIETELVTEQKTETQTPEVLTQMEVTPQMLVAGRQGNLLGPGKILKFDQFPGLHREHLGETIPGAPNFRQVEGTDVFGVAQPTVDGIRQVLDRVGGKENNVVWTNMREEPVVYINGRSFSLREEAHPFENSADFQGATGQSVERTEQQLKAEILAEARANGGRILLHGEDANGMTTEWVEVNEDSIQTTAEVYQSFQNEGYKIDFARVPVTDEKTPENGDLQAVVNRVTEGEDGSVYIFNCHAGRGRTTTAMVAAQLIQRAQNPDAQQMPLTRVDSVRQDIREQGNYDQGNYRLILSLINHLDSGVSAKTETDQVLDQTEHIQNLRTDINRYRKKSLSSEDPGSAQRAESKGLDYLHRYHTLVTFNQYVKDQAPKGFEQTFEQWLEARPEITDMLESFELAMNAPVQQLPGIPGGTSGIQHA